MRTRVALAKCAQYRPEDISGALEKMFTALGGLKQFIPQGGSILIKPNLLADHAPDKAVTTHPEVVRALIGMVRQCGGNPFIGESPSEAMNLESVLEKTGFRALCEEEDVKFVTFEKEPCITHDYHGLALAVAKAAFDADLIINVPKLKTHSFTLFTNAVKNVFGLLPGFQKALLHKSLPTPRQFGDCLAFLYGVVKPGLTVCDAVTAMEGDGPSGGTPVQLGFLAASADGVALDIALCNMLKINPNEVAYFDSLRQRGIGESDPDNIDLVGDSQELNNIHPIKQPRLAKAARFIPRWLVRLLEPYLWIRPSFRDDCTACGRCIKACPVKALELDQIKKPALDRNKCIGCCCCHEVCPERAIKMIGSPLLILATLRNFKNET
ncbi:MAG: DUF362 domain-containing protein [Kiritimatiellia bacterium]|nr:DUF362 domain-containing protein [Kiritimatiellia bacterium]